ncbi:MAG: hypothetical protein ACTSVI_02295 [Promethearchaeota archaeon]
MKVRPQKTMLIFSIFLISMFVVPGAFTTSTKAVKIQEDMEDFFSSLDDPTKMSQAFGTILGGIGGPNIFQDILGLIFGQIQNFNDQEMLPNVFVFNATAGSTTNSTVHRSKQDYYSVWAPFVDQNGNTYRVNINRTYDVDISFQQNASIVIILWDDDGSFIKLIKKVLVVVNEAINYTKSHPGDEIPETLVNKASETLAWAFVHINDIITGDEQIIFQPSYYWSYSINGNLTDTRQWINETDDSIITNPLSDIPGLASAVTDDDYLDYLTQPNINVHNHTMTDTGFLFHLFQLWMQKFQLHFNMTKIAALAAAANGGYSPGDDALSNLLEGVDIQFTFTQHHLLGGFLYNDSKIEADGVPTVEYLTLNDTYTDDRGIEQNVTIPISNEVEYKMDLADVSGGWTVMDPTVVTKDGKDGIKWNVEFQNPTLRCTPVGMDDYDAQLSNSTVDIQMASLTFGFIFQPSFETLDVPDESGQTVKRVKFGAGVVKLDQAFGAVSGGLPSELAGLDLAVLYFSHIFTFDFKYINEPNYGAQDIDHYYRSQTGTLDFLNASDKSYFGAIDIAGPNYETRGTQYPAQTEIIPFALFNFTFNAERTIENDNFSISQGEPAFRTQSLYFGITSAWAFYCVAYPEWDGSALVHDPTFSIFMTLDQETPWAMILLFITIGAIVALIVVLYMRRSGRV